MEPDKVLKSAVGELNYVAVIGYDKEGEMYLAASTSDLPGLLWLMELTKKRILEMGDDDC